MPLIGIDSYNIDFIVVDGNDPKSFIVIDNSRYLDLPEKPRIDIIPPGFTGFIEKPYNPGTITIIDSVYLDLTEPCDYNCLPDIPDGVYQIIMKICPYADLYNKKCHLKTSQLEKNFQLLLIGLDKDNYLMSNTKTKQDILDIEILLLSAKAEASVCNIQLATEKYTAAFSKVDKLSRKLNC